MLGGRLLSGARWTLLSDCIAQTWRSFFVCFQVTEWGADGIIVGSALVKALGEAASPDEGLKALRSLARSIKQGSKKPVQAA